MTMEINATEMTSRIVLDVRIVGLKIARLRLWLGAQIMKLAGLVAGCKIQIEFSQEFDELPPLPRTRSWILVGGVEVPRQASVRGGSPLYVHPEPWGRMVDFYLDGVRQEKVVSYDLDAGYIRVMKKGADGQPFIAGDEIATEILRGTIEVKAKAVP